MKYRIEFLATFEREAKKLKKHYTSFIDDLALPLLQLCVAGVMPQENGQKLKLHQYTEHFSRISSPFIHCFQSLFRFGNL